MYLCCRTSCIKIHYNLAKFWANKKWVFFWDTEYVISSLNSADISDTVKATLYSVHVTYSQWPSDYCLYNSSTYYHHHSTLSILIISITLIRTRSFPLQPKYTSVHARYLQSRFPKNSHLTVLSVSYDNVDNNLLLTLLF